MALKKQPHRLSEHYYETMTEAVGLYNQGRFSEAAQIAVSAGKEWMGDPDAMALLMCITLGQEGEDGSDRTGELVMFCREYLRMSYNDQFKSSGLFQKEDREPFYVLSAVTSMLERASSDMDEMEKRHLASILLEEPIRKLYPLALSMAGFLAFETGDMEGAIEFLSAYISESGDGMEEMMNKPDDEVTRELVSRAGLARDTFGRALMVMSMAFFALKNYEAGMEHLRIAQNVGVGLYNDMWDGEYYLPQDEGENSLLKPFNLPGVDVFPVFQETASDTPAASFPKGDEYEPGIGGLMPVEETGKPGGVKLSLERKGFSERATKRDNPKIFFSVIMSPDGSFRKAPPGLS